MNIREAFISALEEEEPDKFLEYIEKHVSRIRFGQFSLKT